MKKNKKENSIYVYIILLIIFIFLSVIIYEVVKNNKDKTTSSKNENINLELNEDIIIAGSRPFDSEKKMKIVINDIEYDFYLENNMAAFDLMSLAPLNLYMNDLDNNEKYSYLSYSLTNEDDFTGKIIKGDVMLYQSNCIVLFYKNFDTTYTYTKLGHIENLPDINSDPITVIIK